jgi:hypothetical protein
MKKVISLLLITVMLTGTLISCGSASPVVMTYNDSKITSNMYSYWLSTYKSKFLNYYSNSMDNNTFWDSPAEDGVTTDQYAMNLINENIKFNLIGMQLFRDYGLEISPDIIASINDDINEKIDYYGGLTQLNAELSAFGINADILKEIYTDEEKLNAVYDYLYGENGIEKVTESTIDTYYADNYSRIKYIIIYTKEKDMYDENGKLKYDSEGLIMTEPLSEEEIAAKEAKIEEAMICVNAGDEFEGILTDYNETDMSGYPNGFYISANELGIYGFAMVNAVRNMKVGEIRRVDDTDAVYIIKKYDLIDRNDFTDSDKAQLENLKTNCIQEIYKSKFTEYASNIEINQDELSKFSIRTSKPNPTF